MTTKTMKTILFASLIAAMILPFGSINYADAVSSENKNDTSFNADAARSILASKLVKANEDKSAAKDSKALEKADRTLERIDIFSQLVDIKEAIDNETDPKQIEILDKKAQKLILKYQNSIQPEEIELSTPVESSLRHVLSNPISFSTTQSRNADCTNPNKTWGYHTGNGYSYTTHIITNNWASHPSSVGTGGGLGGCDTHAGQYLENKLSTITATCWHYMWPVSGTFNNQQCNTIQMLDVVLVENQAWYAGGEMFNAAYGWTVMVT